MAFQPAAPPSSYFERAANEIYFHTVTTGNVVAPRVDRGELLESHGNVVTKACEAVLAAGQGFLTAAQEAYRTRKPEAVREALVKPAAQAESTFVAHDAAAEKLEREATEGRNNAAPRLPDGKSVRDASAVLSPAAEMRARENRYRYKDASPQVWRRELLAEAELGESELATAVLTGPSVIRREVLDDRTNRLLDVAWMDRQGVRQQVESAEQAASLVRNVVRAGRQAVAAVMGAKPGEIVTSSGQRIAKQPVTPESDAASRMIRIVE